MNKIKSYINAYYRYYTGDVIDALNEMLSLVTHLNLMGIISDSEYKELNQFAHKMAKHYDYSIA